MSDERAERVAVDTTVVVSAFIGQGIPTQVIQQWQADRFVLVVSAAIVAEYADVLSRTRIRVRYGVDPEDAAAFLEDIRSRADLVTSLAESELPLHARDPKDDLFLACALAGGCQYLVTGDHDLLDLNGHPALGLLRIVTPRQYVETGDGAARSSQR